MKKSVDDDLTLEEIKILIGLIIEKNNIVIEGIEKEEKRKEKYRKKQAEYSKKRKIAFNRTT